MSLNQSVAFLDASVGDVTLHFDLRFATKGVVRALIEKHMNRLKCLLPISFVYFGSGGINGYEHLVTPAARLPAPGRTAVRRWRSPAFADASTDIPFTDGLECVMFSQQIIVEAYKPARVGLQRKHIRQFSDA
jgi:hypothetical protein